MVLRCMWFALLIVGVSSCSSNQPMQREARQAVEDMFAPRYSIVFVIHGDGDYLYHDANGGEHNANEEALAGARRVALQNPHAEVFIFHQQPSTHFLFFFPRHDGEFSYYQNGRLIITESYWRDMEGSHLNSELQLYHDFHVKTPADGVRMFLYYGHEIPEFDGTGYDASRSDRKFTVQDLATGLERFNDQSAKFDLLVLSTCFGGTPYTIATLGPSARYIIASPDNLHLSYFDAHSLERLDQQLRNDDVSAYVESFAHHAFDRLTADIQTAVSVAVYDVNRVQGFLRSVREHYGMTLNTLSGNAQSPLVNNSRCDCADLQAYSLTTMSEGVKVFYRPARFGRATKKQAHSGWECWRERNLQGATLQTQKSNAR